ncbi:DUF6916 family protein [Undibacterium danionis]|uniref:DUF6916 family protein n=1 Tax=Undibacterium danionis TaxID=1812100 RepID=A0ABV6IDA4_9BURK
MSISYSQALSALHSSFIAHTSEGTVELRLIEAKELPRKGLSDEFRTPMLLIFSAPSSPILAQDNYYCDHTILGRHFWTLTPVIAPTNAPQTVKNIPLMFYQAIFN